jgi:repressor LexA
VTSLTEKQATVLAYISRHIRRYGYAPSVREIATATGRSRTAAHALVTQLAKRGAIKHDKYSHRAIELL